MIKNILVPIRLGKSIDPVIQMTKKIAKTFQAKVILLNVASEENEMTSSNVSYLEDLKNELNLEGIDVEDPILTKGDILKEVIHTAERKNADLILKLAETEPGSDNTLNESNIKYIRKTDVPIWEVKPGSSLEMNRIVCPIDFSEHSERALRHATALSSVFSSELLVLSVFEPPKPTFTMIDTENADKELMADHKKLLDSFLDKINFSKLNWNLKIKSGEPSEEIIASIEEFDANLLIMGSAGHSGISRKILGSVAEKVIKSLPCSYIVLREKDMLNISSLAGIIDN